MPAAAGVPRADGPAVPRHGRRHHRRVAHRRARPAVTSTGARSPRSSSDRRHRPDVRQRPARRSPTTGPPTRPRRWWPSCRPPTPRAGPPPWRCAATRRRCASTSSCAPTLPIAHAARCSTPTSTPTTGELRPAAGGPGARRRRATSSPGARPSVAAVAVDELVGLHAPRWGDPTLDRARVAARRPRAGSADGRAMLLPTLWAGFQERYADRARRRTCARPATRCSPTCRRYLAPDAASRGRSSTATTGSTTCCSTAARRRRRWPWSTGRPARSARRCSDVAYFIGAGLARRRPARRTRRGSCAATTTASSPPGVDGYDWDAAAGPTTAAARSPGCSWRSAASMLVERTERGDEMFMAMASPPRPPRPRPRRARAPHRLTAAVRASLAGEHGHAPCSRSSCWSSPATISTCWMVRR